MPDRVDRLREAAQARHEATLRRATNALQRLARRGELVTFRRLAETAGVSRSWPAACAASSSSRVSCACWWCTGRNSAVVWKSGQVKQALGCGQSCCGGRPQYPFGRTSAARANRCLTHSASAVTASGPTRSFHRKNND